MAAKGELVVATAASGQVITTALMRSWLGLVHTSDDTKIDDLIEAATVYCEQEIPGHRQIRQATYDLPVSGWWQDELSLPRPPLSSVTSVKYYDSSGTQQTWASTNYEVRAPMRGAGKIGIVPGTVTPQLDTYHRWPITIRFVAGYSTVTAPIKQAIRFLVTQWYDNRVELSPNAIKTVERLLNSEGWGSYE